jgi:hypothetical protein
MRNPSRPATRVGGRVRLLEKCRGKEAAWVAKSTPMRAERRVTNDAVNLVMSLVKYLAQSEAVRFVASNAGLR